jgi:hypothetical protein
MMDKQAIAFRTTARAGDDELANAVPNIATQT